MVSGNSEEKRPLLQAQSAAADSHQLLKERGQGVQRLTNTADRLRESLRLQAEMARALREKEKAKAKSHKFKIFQKKNKKKHKISAGEGSVANENSSSGDAADTSSRGGDGSWNTNWDDKDNDIIDDFQEGRMTEEQLIRVAVARELTIDELIAQMCARGEDLERQADTFAKNELTVQVQAARKCQRFVICTIVVSLALILIIVLGILGGLHLL